MDGKRHSHYVTQNPTPPAFIVYFIDASKTFAKYVANQHQAFLCIYGPDSEEGQESGLKRRGNEV